MTETKRKKRAAAKKPTDSAPSQFDGGDYHIMDVAEVCHVRYQRARDLILARRFGEIKKDSAGKIIVSKKKVDDFATAKLAGSVT